MRWEKVLVKAFLIVFKRTHVYLEQSVTLPALLEKVVLYEVMRWNINNWIVKTVRLPYGFKLRLLANFHKSYSFAL